LLDQVAGVSREIRTRLPRGPYIPGRNARHPEGAFDALRAKALMPTATAAAAENAAWLAGIDLLEAGFYWEAHEVLEQVWMNAPANAPERYQVQAVIQLANAALKQLMDRPRAALRLCAITRDLAGQARRRGGKAVMGLDEAALSGAADRLEAAIRRGEVEPVRLAATAAR
jgi:hypothetical protein